MGTAEAAGQRMPPCVQQHAATWLSLQLARKGRVRGGHAAELAACTRGRVRGAHVRAAARRRWARSAGTRGRTDAFAVEDELVGVLVAVRGPHIHEDVQQEEGVDHVVQRVPHRPVLLRTRSPPVALVAVALVEAAIRAAAAAAVAAAAVAAVAVAAAAREAAARCCMRRTRAAETGAKCGSAARTVRW